MALRLSIYLNGFSYHIAIFRRFYLCQLWLDFLPLFILLVFCSAASFLPLYFPFFLLCLCGICNYVCMHVSIRVIPYSWFPNLDTSCIMICGHILFYFMDFCTLLKRTHHAMYARMYGSESWMWESTFTSTCTIIAKKYISHCMIHPRKYSSQVIVFPFSVFKKQHSSYFVVNFAYFVPDLASTLDPSKKLSKYISSHDFCWIRMVCQIICAH